VNGEVVSNIRNVKLKKAQLEYVGNNNNPVIIIDDYLPNPNKIINFALKECNFDQDKKSFYPGMRALLPKEYVTSCLRPLIPHLYSIYGIPKHLSPHIVDTRFSLITNKAKDLEAIQTLPHFDTPSRYTIAILHYLNDQPHGGTGLFRHKPTGYEHIDEPKQTEYFSYIEKYVDIFNKSEAAYCPAESDSYECYKTLEFKLNRLVAYPGCLLHTALVNPETDIDNDARTGRLTANMLIEFK